MKSSKFRPRFECLEGRDVPAAFSFQLPDGVGVAGQFATPTEVDPGNVLQGLAVPDLTVLVGGTAFGLDDFAAEPVAYYSYGEFRGVQFDLLSPPGYGALGGIAEGAEGYALIDGVYYSIPMAYDVADTQATFTLPDGVTGAMSYDIPWDQVDATLASQSLALNTFNLNIAGQNFTYGSANFTTAPTAEFEYGEFKGITFAINTSTSGIGYSSISAASGTVTAVVNGTNAPVNAPLAAVNASVVLDFSAITIPTNAQGDQVFKIRVTAADGTEKSADITVKPGDTKTQVRDAFEAELVRLGFKATAVGNSWLDIKGTKGGSQLKKVETFNFGYTGQHPALIERTMGPDGTKPEYLNIT